MLSLLKRIARGGIDELSLPGRARDERRRDRRGLPATDPGVDAIETASLGWLAAAQDHSTSHDGGIARHFSLLTGWSASYPETSGYIVPTLIDAGVRRGDSQLISRAQRCLDWLTGIQFETGGFQGGVIGETPVVPVTFNTGQILIGLAAGRRHFGNRYDEPMHRAAGWLVTTIDPDGCWRRHPTPFAEAGEKAYETHVAWGLIEAARACGPSAEADSYASTALRNARWALRFQRSNGWFDQCCLNIPATPLTHTIGYVFRGIVEIYDYTREEDLLASAKKLADGVIACVDANGRLPGRLDANWRPAVDWVCCTGSAQIAHSLLILHRFTNDSRYRDAAFRLLSYVRRTVHIDGDAGVRGAVKGSFPVDGQYGTYQFLNWAAKFLIDADQAERFVRAGQ